MLRPPPPLPPPPTPTHLPNDTEREPEYDVAPVVALEPAVDAVRHHDEGHLSRVRGAITVGGCIRYHDKGHLNEGGGPWPSQWRGAVDKQQGRRSSAGSESKGARQRR